MTQTYGIKDIHKWKQNRDQMDYGRNEYYTPTQKHKILNRKYACVYDTINKNKWSPEDHVRYESYFFTGEENLNLEVFLEEMTDHTIEITRECCIFLRKVLSTKQHQNN